MTVTPWFTQIDEAVRDRDRFDPFRWIREATHAHRGEHYCWAYPYEDGSVLGAIVAALHPARVLELGAALGYTTCWWASHGAQVDTIENDPVHVRLARENVERAQSAGTVTVHVGDFDAVLPSLGASYDLAFFDGYEPPARLLAALGEHLRPDGVLVATNLDLGGGRFRSILASAADWNTHFLEDIAISVRT